MSGRVVVGTLLLVAIVAAVATYGAFGANIWRWGCPSDVERIKLRTPEEVVDAFENHDVELARVPLPSVLANGAPLYDGAALYRHSAASAHAFVLVCKARCATSRFIGGNNVVVWITAADRRSGASVSGRAAPALGDLTGAVDPDSRCYIN